MLGDWGTFDKCNIFNLSTYQCQYKRADFYKQGMFSEKTL